MDSKALEGTDSTVEKAIMMQSENHSLHWKQNTNFILIAYEIIWQKSHYLWNLWSALINIDYKLMHKSTSRTSYTQSTRYLNSAQLYFSLSLPGLQRGSCCQCVLLSLWNVGRAPGSQMRCPQVRQPHCTNTHRHLGHATLGQPTKKA